MHLINPLVAGIRGAENGTASLTLRGTATYANYYDDFEATQQHPGSSIPLDSNGSNVVYVAELVSVRVFSEIGVLVREFVAGDEDAAVEVISPSFTGVDYTSGASGVQKPTNLARVLDEWIASAGSPDWKVLVGGVATTMQAAVALAAATYFNVKTYGALGNGTGDDTAAITAAIAAATAVGGGTVFFPPGVYRTTSGIALPGNIHLLGSGGMASKLALDNAADAAIVPGANGVGALSSVSHLWVGGINTAGCQVIGMNYNATGEFHFTDCVLGNDALCHRVYDNGTSLAACKTVFTRCYMQLSAGSTTMIRHLGAGRLTVQDCDLISVQTISGVFVQVDDGGTIIGNRFDDSAATLGSTNYIQIAPATYGMVCIVGNQFAPNFAFPPTAIYNSLAVPNRDCMEYGNVFGNVALGPFGVVPYGYATDGYANVVSTLPTSGHGSRAARAEGYAAAVGATQTVDPKAYGTTIIERTVGAALTVNANRGSIGDKWTLHIINETGAGLTVTAGTNIIFDPIVTGGTLVMALAGRSLVHLEWQPTGGGTTGVWYQSAKAVTS